MDPKLAAQILALELMQRGDEDRIVKAARELNAVEPKQQILDPQLLEQAATLGGYRGQFGMHPAPVGPAPGIQFRMESDTAAQPTRPKRRY